MLKKTQVTLNLRLRLLAQHNLAIWVLVIITQSVYY